MLHAFQCSHPTTESQFHSCTESSSEATQRTACDKAYQAFWEDDGVESQAEFLIQQDECVAFFKASNSEDPDECPTLQTSAECGLKTEGYATPFFEDKGCEKRSCPSERDLRLELLEIAEMLAKDVETCVDEYKAYWYSHSLVTMFISQGCEYDFNEVGFDNVGVDASLLGRCRVLWVLKLLRSLFCYHTFLIG